ncbi:MAG: hypothetical protein JSU83_01925 [Deltaproteobacteria bacterium]|nr:MAG: hypothetical protein JSU83_01925 [Deltaproteobacteria bacterium]
MTDQMITSAVLNAKGCDVFLWDTECCAGRQQNKKGVAVSDPRGQGSSAKNYLSPGLA